MKFYLVQIQLFCQIGYRVPKGAGIAYFLLFRYFEEAFTLFEAFIEGTVVLHECTFMSCSTYFFSFQIQTHWLLGSSA